MSKKKNNSRGPRPERRLRRDVEKVDELRDPQVKTLLEEYAALPKGDPHAQIIRDKVMESYMPQMLEQAEVFHKQSGVPVEELVNAGAVDLLHAMNEYDPEHEWASPEYLRISMYRAMDKASNKAIRQRREVATDTSEMRRMDEVRREPWEIDMDAMVDGMDQLDMLDAVLASGLLSDVVVRDIKLMYGLDEKGELGDVRTYVEVARMAGRTPEAPRNNIRKGLRVLKRLFSEDKREVLERILQGEKVEEYELY